MEERIKYPKKVWKKDIKWKMDSSVFKIKDKRIFKKKKEEIFKSIDNKKRKKSDISHQKWKVVCINIILHVDVMSVVHTRIASISKNHHEIVAVHIVYTGVPNNTAGSSIVW